LAVDVGVEVGQPEVAAALPEVEAAVVAAPVVAARRGGAAPVVAVRRVAAARLPAEEALPD